MIESGEAAASRWNDLARDMKYSRASAGIARALLLVDGFLLEGDGALSARERC